MLKLNDLAVKKDLDSKAMGHIAGGWDPMSLFLDRSTSMTNKVADVQQAFGFAFNQANAGAVTNNQEIIGGNGIVYAPVHQDLNQHNDLYVADIGNTAIY